MYIDQYSRVSLDADDIFDLIYSKKPDSLEGIFTDKTVAEQFNQAKKLNHDEFGDLKFHPELDCSIEQFDQENQKNWFMPEEYKTFDIEQWLVDQCKTAVEIDRVKTELDLFHRYKMIDVLKFLKYLVDIMKSNNIVWGVGRGSSTASYCLYLMEVHKIDSIRYQLDIKEFLK
jgi:DNA polymerase III alpha subunit